MNLFTKQKQTHRHRKQVYHDQRGQWGQGWKRETVISESTHRHKYMCKIDHQQDLLYSTGKYLITIYNGKECEKEYICVYN